uniref:NB-ARC domain-containing protein n=1 Tax=Setaria italica TaxID=4555 RepID=K3ZZA2_SETIT
MKTIISTIVDELGTRSLSFLIDRYFKPAPSRRTAYGDYNGCCCRFVLQLRRQRGGACITNQAMLQQLNMLRTVVYRCYYMLDTFIQLLPEEEDKKDHGVSPFLSLSKFSPAKRPYSTYLFMQKCMFGRQLEMERVITFLLHEEPPLGYSFGVLPIVGPGKVGNTTLVEHVCCDERVRNHFSHILFLSDNDFREEKQKILCDFGMDNDHIFLPIAAETTQYCVVHNYYWIVLDNEETPKLTMLEVLSGSVPPNGNFDFLVWKSQLPPYHNHIYSSEILDLECEVTRNKQGQKRKILS